MKVKITFSHAGVNSATMTVDNDMAWEGYLDRLSVARQKDGFIYTGNQALPARNILQVERVED